MIASIFHGGFHGGGGEGVFAVVIILFLAMFFLGLNEKSE